MIYIWINYISSFSTIFSISLVFCYCIYYPYIPSCGIWALWPNWPRVSIKGDGLNIKWLYGLMEIKRWRWFIEVCSDELKPSKGGLQRFFNICSYLMIYINHLFIIEWGYEIVCVLKHEMSAVMLVKLFLCEFIIRLKSVEGTTVITNYFSTRKYMYRFLCINNKITY